MLVPLPDLPALFASVEWTLVIPQQTNRSEFTGRLQVVGLPGAEHWRVKASVLPFANEAEQRAWRAFIVACRGVENTFHMPTLPLWPAPPEEPTITDSVTGNRAVELSSVDAITLGMEATVEQADGHFRKVVVVGIDGSNVHFEPYLTSDPEIGSTFNIAAPFCPMRMTSNELSWRRDAVTGGFEFEAEEAL